MDKVYGELRSAGLNQKHATKAEDDILSYIAEDHDLAKHIDMIISMHEHRQNEEGEDEDEETASPGVNLF
jgi:hypothetical protein